MHSCKSWTIKKAEHQRIDAFERWCWRRLLKVPWTARRSNQSIWREINTEYSLEWQMMKLKLQCFGYLMQRDDSLRLGKIEGRRERGIRGWDGWTALLKQWSWTWANSRRLWGTGRPGALQSMGSQTAGQNFATELNWSELKKTIPLLSAPLNWFFFLSNLSLVLQMAMNLLLTDKGRLLRGAINWTPISL